MGLATPPPRPTTSKPAAAPRAIHFGSISMSQGFHQGIFSFSDGFDRSAAAAAAAQASQHHIAQQSRRDKLRGVHGFDPSGHPLVPPIDDDDDDGGPTGGDHHHGYEPGSAAGNMLSEMFNFPPAPGGPSATDLLASQISAGYRMPVGRQAGDVGFSGEWYGGGRPQGLNADSAAAMQLFLMNPPQAPPHQPASPNQAYQAAAVAAGSFGVGESQGLSLSLSSSLQQFEMAKAAADHQNELRVRDGVLYFNSTGQPPQQQQLLSPSSLHLHGQQSQGHGQPGQQQQHMGYGGGGGHMAVVNVLRSSKYARAAQELLEEFCSVGRGQLKGSRIGRHHGASSSSNPNNNNNNPSSSSAGAGGAGSSSSAKEPPPLSPADRFEHQRKKSKLLSMLDEVDRRYNHYCDQMQLVVNSFDSVMGFGAATPYTALAQKAMSRHFRCLKDAIAAQLKKTCELLGEKDAGAAGAGSGITKGETPRLRLLDQSLRQQRAFHQMGMMEQEAWRPQRGLPERSVSILRAWLFEHFLHPYPSDADKHLLARQTGLSRNQVSNWFINARVRLWKPMVEEMYQQESKDEGAEDGQAEEGAHQRAEDGQRAESEAPESSPSPASISRHHHMFPSDHPPAAGAHQPADDSGPIQLPVIDPHELCGPDEDLYRQYGAAAVRFGAASATTGDVTLTLGLRHAGNAPEKGRFSVRDFGGI